jgi:hypothetical protein
MRRILPLLCSVLLAAPVLAGGGKEVTDLVDHPFSADFASGGRLSLDVRSGDVRVVGGDEDKILVELSGRNAPEARDLRVRFEPEAGSARLRIRGGPRNHVRITIRIPRTTSLYARIPFGDVEIENVVGDMDVSIHAGDLKIEIGNPADYGRVDASVTTGDLNGSAFGESKDGLFRSIHRVGDGPYRLRAHVGAGDLSLR